MTADLQSRPSEAQAAATTASEPIRDGRHARSKTSRAKIVAAMLDLVGAGDVQPSAARVAEAAGVGLRTVFRHFADMDSLYREMSEAIEAKVLPILLKPFAAEQWRERIREMALRRTELFEAILPYRISASLKRFQSTFLMQDYRRLLRMERNTIDAVLPPAVLADPVAANSLYLALNFQGWRALRHDQELPVEMARAVFLNQVEAVLSRITAD
jgi:AcrR family transcriptional regulator